jgi:hypothetical protein
MAGEGRGFGEAPEPAACRVELAKVLIGKQVLAKLHEASFCFAGEAVAAVTAGPEVGLSLHDPAHFAAEGGDAWRGGHGGLPFVPRAWGDFGNSAG